MDDFNRVEYEDEYIQGLVDFVAGESFQSYFLRYAEEFTDDEELKLHYYDRYKEFHDLFEEQLEIFCDKMDITQKEFMRRCKSAATSDKKASHYIQILLSSVEFETFVKLMRIMRPVAIAKKRSSQAADAKPTARSPDKAASKKASKELDSIDFDKEAATLEIDDYEADAKGDADGMDARCERAPDAKHK